MAKGVAKFYRPYGVECRAQDLIRIAEANGLASHQTVRNWIKHYGETDTGVEVMLQEKFKITTKYELERKLDKPDADKAFNERNSADIAAMGFPPFSTEKSIEDEKIDRAIDKIQEILYPKGDNKEDDTVPIESDNTKVELFAEVDGEMIRLTAPDVIAPVTLDANTAVHHPKHYNTGSIEVWDAIIAWDLDFILGNVVKYVARAGHKGDKLEDLLKAKAYIDKAIEEYAHD